MKVTDFIMPLIALIIIVYGVKNKVQVYDAFIEGAKEGIETCIEIFPVLLTMIFAISILVNSNILNFVFSFLSPVFSKFNIPSDIVPLMFLRPISGSSSLVLVSDIFANFGPDSYIGRLASVLQGCTDTTIYVLSLYFGSVGIKKTRYALFNGLFADLVGIIASVILVNILFY